MIDALKPYQEYNESGLSVLPHLRKSAESVDKILEDDPQIKANDATNLRLSAFICGLNKSQKTKQENLILNLEKHRFFFTNHSIEFKNVHLRSGFAVFMLLAMEYIEKEPQINADERRLNASSAGSVAFDAGVSAVNKSG